MGKCAVGNMRSTAVFMPSKPDATMPSKEVVREAQVNALGVLTESEISFTDSLGRIFKDDEDLFRVNLSIDGRDVLWIPDTAKKLQVRLMVCAHMKEEGHRGSAATLQRNREYLAAGLACAKTSRSSLNSASIAWTPNPAKKCRVHSEKPHMVQSRERYYTSTPCMWAKAARFEKRGWTKLMAICICSS